MNIATSSITGALGCGSHVGVSRRLLGQFSSSRNLKKLTLTSLSLQEGANLSVEHDRGNRGATILVSTLRRGVYRGRKSYIQCSGPNMEDVLRKVEGWSRWVMQGL